MSLENNPAPNFTLLDQDSKQHTLSDYLGTKVLIYFYPKDMTPGCTVQAKGMRDSINDFKKLNVQVLGISVDDIKSHKKFVEKHNLNFPLLADTDKEVVNLYQVWTEKSMFGKKYMGIVRDSFLINEKGILVKHFPKVNPLKHSKLVMDYIKNNNL